jgi:hypothetical protein
LTQSGAKEQVPWEEGRNPIYLIKKVHGSRSNERKTGTPYILYKRYRGADPMGGWQESHIFDT